MHFALLCSPGRLCYIFHNHICCRRTGQYKIQAGSMGQHLRWFSSNNPTCRYRLRLGIPSERLAAIRLADVSIIIYPNSIYFLHTLAFVFGLAVTFISRAYANQLDNMYFCMTESNIRNRSSVVGQSTRVAVPTSMYLRRWIFQPHPATCLERPETRRCSPGGSRAAPCPQQVDVGPMVVPPPNKIATRESHVAGITPSK